jgi:hypothetical protein
MGCTKLPPSKYATLQRVSLSVYLPLYFRKCTDTWEGGLKATCGAIVPEKTFWYLIDFSWQSGQCKYKTISECPAKIEIKDIKGVRKELQRYEVHNAQEMSGEFLAPDGNPMKQIEKMKNAAIKWADCMRSGHISRDDAWLSFYSTIWKTLLYPLPALNLNKETYNKIMTPILNYLLPAMGICRNFPRTLVYSSTKYMGLGLKHPHTIQEILWIKDILKHTHLLTTTGQLYRISLELLFLEVGMGHDLSVIPKVAIDLLATPSLIRDSCYFLKQHNLNLQHDIKIRLLRPNDQILMAVFYELNPSYEELTSLNHCRLYLQVYFLSEICTGDGHSISADVWDGKRCESTLKTLAWPR